MKRRIAQTFLAAVACLLFGSVGYGAKGVAQVGLNVAGASIDTETGEGFVGMGRLRSGFGGNNGQLQNNLSDIEFVLESRQAHELICKDRTDMGHVTVLRQTALISEPRKNERGKVTAGFDLKGFDGEPVTTIDGEIPPGCELGDPVGEPRFTITIEFCVNPKTCVKIVIELDF